MKQIFLKTMLVAIATLSGLTVIAQPGYFGPFYTHTSSVSNISNNWTNLSNPALDGNGAAKIIITQNWGTSGNYADFKPAIWYSGSPAWAIYNEDGSTAFADSTAWNILVPDGSNGTVFSHTSSSANIVSNQSVITNPALDGNPNAIFFITHNYSGNGVGVYNNHNTGVWYNGTNWALYNEDISAFVDSAVYDIFVPSPGNGNAFKHTSHASNNGSNYTIIDNVLTNDQPSRIIFVTHNFGLAGGNYCDNPLGVWYTGSKWSIFNQNIATMDTNVVFNVLVADAPSGIEEQTTNANFMTVFPNPATDNINLGYVLTKPGTVNLKIINITGQQVKAVYTGTQPAGNFTMQTNTADLAPGIYSYVLTVDGVVSRKMFVKN